MKQAKKQVQALLVERGYCETLDQAKRWIMAGQVLVNERRIDRAAEPVPMDVDIRIKGMSKYVGKGGFKLEGPLAEFGIDLSGRITLDAGASTGGFTDCMVQHGATRVYAVDVAYGSLAAKLRNEQRVINLEKTNISDLVPQDLDPQPSFATMDLSYLSILKAIPIVAELLTPKGEMLCLVKPLFEVLDPEARRKGKITQPEIYVAILNNLIQFIGKTELNVLGATHSPVRGNKGTFEFWLWISKDAESATTQYDINTIVDTALALPPWNKSAAQS